MLPDAIRTAFLVLIVLGTVAIGVEWWLTRWWKR